MRKLLLFWFLLSGVFSLAQITGPLTTGKCSVASATCTITISPTAGNNVHVGISAGSSSATVSSVKMNPSTTSCTLDAGPIAMASNSRGWFYTCANVPASQTSIVVVFGSSNYQMAIASEFSGEPTSSYFDLAGTALVGSSSTNWRTGSITTTNANDVVIGFDSELSNNATFTQVSPWTIALQNNDSSNGMAGLMAYQIVASTGAYQPTGTISAYGTAAYGIAAAYKAATVTPTAAAPTMSLAGGGYEGTQSVTLSTATSGCGSYIFWNFTGTSMSSGTNSTTASVSATNTLYAQVIGCPGYLNSSISNTAYTILTPFTPIYTDNFSGYFNQDVAEAGVPQNPLDAPWTAGVWTTVPTISGSISQPSWPIPGGPTLTSYLTTQASSMSGPGASAYSTYLCAPSVSGNCVSSTSGSGALSVYTGATLPNNQEATGYIRSASSGYGGVGVEDSATGGVQNGYVCVVGGAGAGSGNGQIDIVKIVSGSQTTLASQTGMTISANTLLGCRVAGGTIYLLLNGVVTKTATDSTFTSGSCGVYSQSRGAVSNVSCGGVGSSSSTPIGYSPTYPTYTDTTGSGWTETWPWLQGQVNLTFSGSTLYSLWAEPFIAQTVPSPGSGYGIGVVGSSGAGDVAGEMKYMGVFQDSQWIEATWTHDTAVLGEYWQGLMLKTETYPPGYDNGACAANGNLSQCADVVGYYIETELNRGTAQACPSTRKEYCGVPFLIVFKYTPTSTPWNNEYDWGALDWSPRANDQIYFHWYNNQLRVYCNGTNTTTARWQALTSYAANSYFLDSNGNYQLVDTAGVSGATEPVTYGTAWNYSADQGNQTTSGTMVSEFFGAPCPPNLSNNGWSLLFDTSETDLVGDYGQPGIAQHTGPSPYQFPAFSNIIMGSGHNSTIDTVPYISQPMPWLML